MDVQRMGIVGAGGLGGALVRGLVKSGLPAERLTIYERDETRGRAVATETKAGLAASAAELARDSDVIVVCVKPQHVAAALDAMSAQVTSAKKVISAAAGVTLEKLRGALGANGGLVRAMPNVNVAVGASVTALCGERDEPVETLETAEWLFRHVGVTVRLPDEKLMDAATALAASGPAWLAVVLEALMDGGVQAGLPRDIAVDLALGMAEGTARHLRDGKIQPSALKDMVMSPAGTTAAGLMALEKGGVRGALMAAVDVAAARAAALRSS